MKRLLILIMGVIFSLSLNAQIKNYYFPQEGKVYTYLSETRSPMGDESCIIKSSAKKDANGNIVFSNAIYNKDGKTLLEKNEVVYNVTANGYEADLKVIAKSMLDKFENCKIIASETYTMPLALALNQRFKDCTLKFTGSTQGMDFDITYTVSGMKSDKKMTKVKVGAGEYDALRLISAVEVDMGIQTVTMDMEEYFVEGIGPVKKSIDTMNGMAETTITLQSIE